MGVATTCSVGSVRLVRTTSSQRTVRRASDAPSAVATHTSAKTNAAVRADRLGLAGMAHAAPHVAPGMSGRALRSGAGNVTEESERPATPMAADLSEEHPPRTSNGD